MIPNNQETQSHNPARADEKTRLHETHCDPCGDVTLVSNDGVEFRASSFQFSKISKFFSDAFSLPPPPPSSSKESREPIPLDFPENTMSLFLDLALIPPHYHFTILNDIDDPLLLESLLDLADFAICEGLKPSIDSALFDLSEQYPFEVLTIASRRSHTLLAKRTVRNLRLLASFRIWEDKDRLGRIKDQFSVLSQEYQSELFILLLHQCHARGGNAASVGFSYDDWCKISDRFDPEVPIRSKILEVPDEDESEIED
ncbi:hypothetical protein L486_00355 [Kwoniella mangroviensis CBS 10435]|uniref:BTB domain-containing protein n=1 Tax=Kwoniella mangroviensis CBS 10435 TaxID=1331196 RepID=A0A1B9IYW1_9TREE|nr:uncharacterized protein I203_06324 [Kwoniella mangroviensis CBS 8507]OCF60717.1 hypothetical protein L486_00355 [Kwoniella mangroviensis CBS 10435]OCF64591.1 hypothetical protein I203_06324 [Kwoniella mangroviensis CBS 8507]OCF74534.1 hypothetical protein I204_04911 [Kwoniella mangroviensis CBS 8886]